ncbi:MAG TPA: histidinol-phosphate transaminase [Chitinophagaceae bacterium]|nr:histidinol-phosphate transaminase [Chitinophagaceae bacterium]
MNGFDLDKLVRPNIKTLKPYSSARSEYTGDASVFLDANENAFGSPLDDDFSRYPDPLQTKLKQELSKIKGVPVQNTFIGNGSDEVIDLAFRIFCEPGKSNVIICPPTYGMYRVCANINDVAVKEANLTSDFQLNLNKIFEITDKDTRIIFICSPNNPTGNNLNRLDIETLLNNFPGIVLIDEAYINYSSQKSFIRKLTEYENLIVMQTLSKAWGLAALRLGIAFASERIIELFNNVKPPYNINLASQQLGIQALSNINEVNEKIKLTTQQRGFLQQALPEFGFIKKIYPSDTNFILVKTTDANKLYQYLTNKGIIVRNRTKEPLCENCIRITVGTPEENRLLLEALNKYA